MRRNIVYIALSVFGIQGAAYLGQLILAAMLPADQFAVVRMAEAAVQLLSSFAPMGISLLVVKLASQSTDEQLLSRSLTSYLLFAGAAGAVFAAACYAVVSLLEQSNYGTYFLMLVWLVILSNISRTALNYMHGRERFTSVSLASFLVAVVYLLVLVALVRQLGVMGWIWARYLIEAAFLVLGLVFVWSGLGQVIFSAQLYVQLAREGTSVSLSLLFRTGLDTLPLLFLGYIGSSALDTAVFGLCTLIISAGMVLPGSINTVLLPKLAKMFHSPRPDASDLYKIYQKRLIGIGLLIGGLVIIAAGCIEYLIAPRYAGLTALMAGTAMIVPLKAVGSLNANVLFVGGKTMLGVKVHLFALCLALLASALLIPSQGAWGSVAGLVLSEIVACALLIGFARRELPIPYGRA